MPSKKNKNKTNLSPTEEDDGSSDANSPASCNDASHVLPAEDMDMGMVSNMDVIQKLDVMTNDFATKIDVELKAVQDVKRDVQDFSVRMENVEVRISNVEDTVNLET